MSPVSSSKSIIVGACSLSLLMGCSDSTDEPGTTSSNTSGSTTGTTGSADPNQRVGRFDLTIVPPDADSAGSTTLLGKVYAGVYPANVAWEVTATEGDCQVIEPVFPFCDPGCGSSAACVADGECLAYPALKDVGTLTVNGLNTEAGGVLTIEPLSPTNAIYQPSADEGLTYPGVDEGATVRIEASGGEYAPFSVEANGVLPLEVLGEVPILVDREAPMLLSWVEGSDPSFSRIEIELDISHHGGIKGQVTCDVPDTGSLEVPASLVTHLIDLGFSGFPTVVVRRRAVGSTQMDLGRVDMNVTSFLSVPVEIPGLVSCVDDTDCPEGQLCQDDLKCE